MNASVTERASPSPGPGVPRPGNIITSPEGTEGKCQEDRENGRQCPETMSVVAESDDSHG